MRTEPLSKAELVIHPARLRIVQALGNQRLSPRQIGQMLPDIPTASLYRHIKALKEGGIIEVVCQSLDSGIPESTYANVAGGAHFSREEFAAILPEDHKRYFAIFLGSLASTVNGYFEDPTADSTRDGMTYFTANLVLSDEQRRQLRLDLLSLIGRYGQDQPANGRRTQLGISLAPETPSEPTESPV